MLPKKRKSSQVREVHEVPAKSSESEKTQSDDEHVEVGGAEHTTEDMTFWHDVRDAIGNCKVGVDGADNLARAMKNDLPRTECYALFEIYRDVCMSYVHTVDMRRDLVIRKATIEAGDIENMFLDCRTWLQKEYQQTIQQLNLLGGDTYDINDVTAVVSLIRKSAPSSKEYRPLGPGAMITSAKSLPIRSTVAPSSVLLKARMPPKALTGSQARARE